MKKKIVILGVVLAAFLMLITPCISAVNVKATEEDECYLCAKAKNLKDRPVHEICHVTSLFKAFMDLVEILRNGKIETNINTFIQEKYDYHYAICMEW